MTLHYNTICHWLGTFTELSLIFCHFIIIIRHVYTFMFTDSFRSPGDVNMVSWGYYISLIKEAIYIDIYENIFGPMMCGHWLLSSIQVHLTYHCKVDAAVMFHPSLTLSVCNEIYTNSCIPIWGILNHTVRLQVCRGQQHNYHLHGTEIILKIRKWTHIFCVAPRSIPYNIWLGIAHMYMRSKPDNCYAWRWPGTRLC